jgi:hypothetical protein
MSQVKIIPKVREKLSFGTKNEVKGGLPVANTHTHISLISWMQQISFGSGKLAAPLTMNAVSGGQWSASGQVAHAHGAPLCVRFARIAPSLSFAHTKHPLGTNHARRTNKMRDKQMNDLIIWTLGFTFTRVKHGGAFIIYGRSALKQTVVRHFGRATRRHVMSMRAKHFYGHSGRGVTVRR